MAVMICWEDTCVSLRNVTKCRRCQRPWCEEHTDEITGLCMWCVPVEEEEYQKWVIK